jgi:molecular chaperone GrpE
MSDDKKPIDEMMSSPSAASSPESGEIGVEQLKAVIGALQADLEKKSAELAAKQDQFLRAAAETENVRRRLEKEKEDIAKYAITKFAKDILSVGDNFQRAISAVPKDAVESDPALKTLLDGVILAERDYKTALERHDIRVIDPAGQPFNPHQHQAVMEQENSSVPAGTVLQVYQVGYLLDDRNLRPAMVVVSRGGPRPGKTDDGGPESNADKPPSADA